MVPEVDNFYMQSVAERRYQYWEAFTTQSIEGPQICAQQQSNQNQPILQSTPLFVRTESLSWNEVNTMELDAPCRILTACKLVSLWEKKTAASEVAELFRRESLAGKLHDIAQCLEEDSYIEMTVKILGCGCVLQCCTTQPPPDESFGQMLYPTNKKQRGGG